MHGTVNLKIYLALWRPILNTCDFYGRLVGAPIDSIPSISNPITGLDRPWNFQEVEAPRFQDNWHMNVVMLPYAQAVFTP
jgi:hypothetical protein